MAWPAINDIVNQDGNLQRGTLYIGLMSGTSMDGIDCALVNLQQGLQVIDYTCTPLPARLRDTLFNLCSNSSADLSTLGSTDIAVAHCFAAAVTAMLAAHKLGPEQVAAIGSHGQTIWHEPPQRAGQHAFTMQLGDPNTIATLTGITTVADFRRRDMAAGGQGAPIVPALHRELFSRPDRTTVVLNLGGIANITVLPPAGGKPFGFDTGPASVLMDSWIYLHQGLHFDDCGNWASSGTVQPALLTQLLSEPYLEQPAPKSTGRELFNPTWLKQAVSACAVQMTAVDVQATLLEYTAITVRDAVLRYAQAGELIVCGGGARNIALLARLQVLLRDFNVDTSTSYGLHADCVEAAAFAWFASRALRREKTDFSPFTGASGPVLAGGIYYAD